MTGRQLEQFRKQGNHTQVEAAQVLGVSQTYLSLLESGKRPLSDKLKEKAVRAFGASPTALPFDADPSEVSDEQLAVDLATLGYSGFSYLKKSHPKNPATVLFSALNSPKREARLVEALPWVLLRFPDLEWGELVKAAKVNDLQNRLGFVTNVARRLAESKGDMNTAEKLRHHEEQFDRSLLFREDTLCNESMTSAERKWLLSHRTDDARRWRLLTSLLPEHLNYGE